MTVAGGLASTLQFSITVAPGSAEQTKYSPITVQFTPCPGTVGNVD